MIAEQLTQQAGMLTQTATALQALQAELLSIADEVAALEAGGGNQDQIAEMQNIIDGLTDEVVAAEAALDAARDSLALTQAALDTATAERDAARATVTTQAAQIVQLQADLAAALANGGTPPAGIPLRIAGGHANQAGAPLSAGAWNWAVLDAQRTRIVASGSTNLSAEGQYQIDFNGPFAIGDPVPVWMDQHDNAPPLDRTVVSGLFWTVARDPSQPVVYP